MDLTYLIKHPEAMNKETLYDLRSLTARYPYYQTARLLMLQNLYLLHESSFDDELRRAAIYITDRKVLFNLVEASHYQLRANRENNDTSNVADGDRTLSLIDQFLNNVPEQEHGRKERGRRPTAADATVDYAAYLLEQDTAEEEQTTGATPEMRGQNLIDNFIEKDEQRIQLQEEPEYVPQLADESGKSGEEGYFTETLARIYIKQGRYSKALEIIKRINLNYPKKSVYFADQIRFLEKLIKNADKAKQENKQ
ncbi:MAG: tetratricopeptide repeat protein [Prevotella sp.]|nr:tetratricopeptide repeat protein [Prevotella sp.]